MMVESISSGTSDSRIEEDCRDSIMARGTRVWQHRASLVVGWDGVLWRRASRGNSRGRAGNLSSWSGLGEDSLGWRSNPPKASPHF